MAISEDYVSPVLRMAVFRRINPGAQIDFDVVEIDKAFPHMSLEPTPDCPKAPKHAVRCTLVLADGTWIESFKEIELSELGRDKKWRDIPQTPENHIKNCTKAQGRALTTAGIPQKMPELQVLMRWIAAMNGAPIQTKTQTAVGEVDTGTGEITGRSSADEIDDPDAGNDDHLTPEQELAERFSDLPGPVKAKIAAWAREELGVANVIRAGGQHIDAINRKIDEEEPS